MMSSRIRLIGAALGATLLAAAPIAATQTSAQTTPGTDQQTSEGHAKAVDHVSRMAERCNRMMDHMMGHGSQ
jgi:hypothetical protein